MKFIHIANVRLGATPDADMPWGDVRARELWDTFERVIDDCNRERADMLLISGNLFDRQPVKRELLEAARIFGKLNRTQVVMIAGDRDYIRNASVVEDFSWPEHVHMIMEQKLTKVEFPFMGATVVGVSFRNSRVDERLFDDLMAETDDDYHILMLCGGTDGRCPADLKVLATAGFDYVAVGGEEAGIREREKIGIAGSPEPMGYEDAGRHGYILGVIEPGQTRLSQVPISKREYISLDIEAVGEDSYERLDGILRERISLRGTNNIYTVKVSGMYRGDFDDLTDHLLRVGNILDIEDITNDNVDIELMRREHPDDLIGGFIKAAESQEEAVSEKALRAGISALLIGGQE